MRTFKRAVAVVVFAVLPVLPAAAHNEAAVSLKQDMRKLWTDHVVWTRSYIVAAVADQPEVPRSAI